MTDKPNPSPERILAIITHISTYLGALVPFGNVVAPLGIWFGVRSASDFVRHHAAAAVNFQLSITLYVIISGLLFSDPGYRGVSNGIVTVFVVVMVLVAARAAYLGREYKYPLSIPVLR